MFSMAQHVNSAHISHLAQFTSKAERFEHRRAVSFLDSNAGLSNASAILIDECGFEQVS